MTTNQIADIIITSLCERSFPIFLTTFAGTGIAEADVFAINRNGYMYEFEIKRSRNDFFADFKSKDFKHKRLKNRNALHTYDEWKKGKRTGNILQYIVIPNRYYFVCEEGLILVNEIPEYAGLVYINNNKYMEVKPAKLLHKNKADRFIYARVATILSQRIIYGCSYYTYKQKLQSLKSK